MILGRNKGYYALIDYLGKPGVALLFPKLLYAQEFGHVIAHHTRYEIPYMLMQTPADTMDFTAESAFPERLHFTQAH